MQDAKSIQKNQCVSIHEQSEKEIKKTIPFIIASDIIIKYVRINLTKENYTKNYKTWLKEITEGTNMQTHLVFMDWKTSHC